MIYSTTDRFQPTEEKTKRYHTGCFWDNALLSKTVTGSMTDVPGIRGSNTFVPSSELTYFIASLLELTLRR